ncbi:imm11 family protein [Prevotella sp. 10(H)]|uniref:imm11 family protein n=1 Tax=Prevotella sp. 10(H) TaxID=1158294 RepID=UPI0004A6D023|nr:DUF1629 domain-containing protein [Prevotella sp. 10(H)]
METSIDYYLLLGVNTPAKPGIVLSGNVKRSQIKIKTPIMVKSVDFRFDGNYKKPEMMDYHTDGVYEVVSDKIFSVFEPLKIEKIQLVSSSICDKIGGTLLYKNYYYLHVYNYIQCLDKKLSDIVMLDEELGIIMAINKIVLDKGVLSSIPLEKRLIFRLKESERYVLYHGSVVRKIMESNPSGLRFVKVEDYNQGSAFD